MLDRISAAGRLRPAAGHDANIPPRIAGETQYVSAWDVTLQAGVFVSLVVLPLLLITKAWEAPASAGIMWIAFRAVRHSGFRYQRLRRA
ncbi:hypothetical protein QEZ40_001696 [Streptomyces katrae]|uniref:Uncharacterized protein n=1 Tax=Streptomyces katrae TaxID=68223 RepID=A0ABT7GTW1_9ACTN|nr:hypothetical protein [Streptomyces katrae]MDK9497048.1 hypothetical protein [Streptomyces katrae]